MFVENKLKKINKESNQKIKKKKKKKKTKPNPHIFKTMSVPPAITEQPNPKNKEAYGGGAKMGTSCWR